MLLNKAKPANTGTNGCNCSPKGGRASLTNIRAAIETMEAYSEMGAAKVGQLCRVIYDESLTLRTRLNQVTREHDAVLKANWQLEEMLRGDLLWAVQIKIRVDSWLIFLFSVQEVDSSGTNNQILVQITRRSHGKRPRANKGMRMGLVCRIQNGG